MAFGFQCFELDGVTQQFIGAGGTPSFLKPLAPDLAPAGGTRAFYQGSTVGVPPYQSTTTLLAALSTGLGAAGLNWSPVSFTENAPGTPAVIVNAAGEPAGLAVVPPQFLSAGVANAVRITFSGGLYVEVVGTLAAVSAAIAAALPPSGGGIVGPLKAVYVELPAPNGRGDDATAERGNASLPFSTVEAAMGAMLAGDEMLIGPGLFGTVAPLTPPAACTSFIIRGSGVGVTTIGGQAGVNLVELGPNPLTGAAFADLTLEPKGGGLCILASAAGGAFLNGAGLSLENVQTSGDVAVQYVSRLTVTDVRSSGGAWDFGTCTNVRLSNLDHGGSLSLQWDNADPDAPAVGRIATRLTGCRIQSFVSLRDQVSVYADASCTCEDEVLGNNLTVDGATMGPQIRWHGTTDAFNFAGANAFPDSIAVQVLCDLSGSSSQLAEFEVGAPAANTVTVQMAGAVVGQVTALDGVIVQARTACPVGGVAGQLTTSGTGTIAPPSFAIAGAFAASPTTFPLPLTLPSTDYTVTAEKSNSVTTDLSIPPGSKTASQFDVTSAFVDPATTVRLLISWGT